MAHLFIIEAPGKARSLEAVLKRLDINASVQATKGHLFDMPDNLSDIGIDENFRDFKRRPKDLKIVQRIRSMAQLADGHIYIATDADAEGDVIAWDVATIIKDICQNPVRVKLKGMDDESIKESIAESGPVQKADAVPGRTRAIIDRMIGATFSKNGVAVGRIGTAILGLVSKSEMTNKQIRLVAPAKDGGRPFSAQCDIKSPLTLDIAKSLLQLNLPPVSTQSKATFTPPPNHMGDIMVKAGDRMGLSPHESSASLQRLYEAGRMSYPRAGSRGLSSATVKKIEEVIRKAGYKVDPPNYTIKSDDGVHDAPYPIGKVDLTSRSEELGQDEELRVKVTQELVRSGQKRTIESGVAATLLPFLITKGFSKEVATFIAQLPWTREYGPPIPGHKAWPDQEIVERRSDTVILENAIKAGLGRPSTWDNHIKNFMDRELMDENMKLTEKGKYWLKNSPTLLTDPRISIAIEQACERPTETMFQHADREPWELNAARIFNALPQSLKEPLMAIIDRSGPHPLIDPIVEYGLDRDIVNEVELEATASPAYRPRDEF